MMEALSNAAAVRQFVRYARATGIALESILDEDYMGVVRDSATADKVPAHALVDMLQICALLTRRPHLGASAAAFANVRGGYGLLSLLWEYAPTLAEAMRVNQRFIHLENPAVAFHIEEDADEVTLHHLLMVPTRYGGSQFIEASLTLDLRVAQIVLGESWVPARVEFAHPAPQDTRYLRTLFRCPLEFGADRNAIVIRHDDMTRPAVDGNAHMFAYLERHIEKASRAEPLDLAQQIEFVIAAKLGDGHATLDCVAHELSIGPRTLQRRLSVYGLTFADILDAVRKRTAEEYFRLERQPNLLQLAFKLGYSDASGASRFLRARLQTGAKALRAQGMDCAPQEGQLSLQGIGRRAENRSFDHSATSPYRPGIG